MSKSGIKIGDWVFPSPEGLHLKIFADGSGGMYRMSDGDVIGSLTREDTQRAEKWMLGDRVDKVLIPAELREHLEKDGCYLCKSLLAKYPDGAVVTSGAAVVIGGSAAAAAPRAPNDEEIKSLGETIYRSDGVYYTGEEIWKQCGGAVDALLQVIVPGTTVEFGGRRWDYRFCVGSIAWTEELEKRKFSGGNGYQAWERNIDDPGGINVLNCPIGGVVKVRCFCGRCAPVEWTRTA